MSSPIEIVAEALHEQQSDLSDCPWYQRCLGNNDDGVCDRGCYDEPQCETCTPGDEGWPREVLAKRYALLLTGGEEPFEVSDRQRLDAAAALEALRADGWQIVKTDDEHVPTDDGAVYIAERWTP